MGGGKTYLAPPHIFEWGGPIPPPLFRSPYIYIYNININILKTMLNVIL